MEGQRRGKGPQDRQVLAVGRSLRKGHGGNQSKKSNLSNCTFPYTSNLQLHFRFGTGRARASALTSPFDFRAENVMFVSSRVYT